ncbi:transposase [Falsihalocynthiibacter sp. S25ZX9]|uniref:transposase n=1 Tax=Falsihalocynthiibacter sp. S25ZX9 TaxID=3240870 RepID=UPI00350F536F
MKRPVMSLVVDRKLSKKVEISCAHLKRIHGLGRLRLRSLCGAHDEFFLAATAQNLKKLAKLAPNPIQARATVRNRSGNHLS